jgi:ketosteroid isomerase-like protein
MTSMNNQAFNELLEREAARGRALVERDFDTLAQLMTDDLLHIHSTGVVHDKAAYLDYVRGPLAFLSVERRDLKVKMFGDAAVMTGAMSNVMRPPGPAVPVTVESHVVQIWVPGSAGWQLAVFQATRLPIGA